MLRPSTLLVALTSLALVSAQTANFSTCCSVQPNSVDFNTRLSWCRAQTNTCPLLCQNGQYSENTCDPNTLSYSCSCQGGNTPNISDYQQTLPSLECESWVGQCTKAHPNDLNGQTFCQSFVCGKKNASAVGAGASSSSSSSSAGPSATSSGSASAASSASSTAATAASSSKAAAAALRVAKDYGSAGFALGVLALFGFAL
jgi:hypothetical protein